MDPKKKKTYSQGGISKGKWRNDNPIFDMTNWWEIFLLRLRMSTPASVPAVNSEWAQSFKWMFGLSIVCLWESGVGNLANSFHPETSADMGMATAPIWYEPSLTHVIIMYYAPSVNFGGHNKDLGMAAEFDISKHSTCHDIHDDRVRIDHYKSKRRLGRIISNKKDDDCC